MFQLVMCLLVVSQLYWAYRFYLLIEKRIRNRPLRRGIRASVGAVYFLLLACMVGWLDRVYPEPTHWNRAELLRLPMLWWVPASFFASLLAMVVSLVRAMGWAIARARRSHAAIESPARRAFLEHTATAVVATPFVAGAYGLFYGRLNLETSAHRVRLARLPQAFAGFRIAQLSDIHIGPFMTEEQIRKYVAIANALKPDLIVLTGDFVTFDPTTQRDVVTALSGLRAPFGVYASLGNHDQWAGVEDSITAAFAEARIRMLRQEAVPLRTHGESLNLMGVDFQTRRRFGRSTLVSEYLEGVDRLMAPGGVNILLSHNPDTFDRAAELGIDLSLAGHTHGGQLALEFISPQIAPSRLVTPYVSGWFEKPGGKLYVNRGIGTVFVPIRVGAPPEISVFELVRA